MSGRKCSFRQGQGETPSILNAREDLGVGMAGAKGLQARAVWMSTASVAGAGQATDDEATEAGRGRPCEGMKARGGEEVGVWILFSM